MSQGQGMKTHWGDPRRPQETPPSQDQGQGLRLDGVSQGMGGMSQYVKGGIPQGNPNTHHTTHSIRETSSTSSSCPSEAIKTGKKKKWGRKERGRKATTLLCFPCLFREEKGGAIAPPFSCEMSDALSSFGTAPREPRRKCHQRKVWMTGSKGLRIKGRADNPLSNGIFRSSLSPLDREKNRFKDHIPHSSRLSFSRNRHSLHDFNTSFILQSILYTS